MKRKILDCMMAACCLAAALFCLVSCDGGLDVRQEYPFTVEAMPVADGIANGETVEIRLEIRPEGTFAGTVYTLRYFQPDGKGKLEMDNGTVFLSNDLYPLEKETFRLYYTSASTDQQTIDIYIIDSFGQMQQLTLSFNNDNSEEGTETITP